MKKFKYRAMKVDGTKFEAVFEADSRQDVISMIESNGYYPLKIDEIIESKSIEINLFEKVTKKDLAIFCRQMHTMLDAGVPLISSLKLLSTQIEKKKLKKAIEEMDEDVRKGEMFSEALKKHSKIFPQLMISMIASGEASGNLDEMMLRLSIHFEKDNKISNKVKGAMIYPAVLACVAVGAIALIMIVVMPTFVTMFSQSEVELPLVTKILIGTSDFMSKNVLLILFAVIAVVIGINVFKQTDQGIRFFSVLKLKLPILKTLNKKIIVSRFTRTLATLLSSGVSMVQALPIVSSVLGNTVAEEAMEKIRERVIRGEGLSTPIAESDLFPAMLSSMIKVGEESGALDEILNKTADFYDEEVEVAIQTATGLLEPILIVCMGVVIGTIIISIMVPMYNMYGQV